MPDRFPIVVRTLAGLEPVLEDELRALGCQGITIGHRAVSFQGTCSDLYKANLHCRTAVRVLKTIESAPVDGEDQFYGLISSLNWDRWLSNEMTLAIDALVHSSFSTHSLYIAQRTKDAIVDQFRDRTGLRPSVDLQDPDLRIHVHLHENLATVLLDSSGESLHRRGYRTEAGAAPISEVLAAGILSLSQWDQRNPLIVPMCGSGTFAIEAALMARRVAPGLLRGFGFERWKDYDRRLHSKLDLEARDLVHGEVECRILASDADPAMIKIARQNAERAGVSNDIRFEVARFEDWMPPAGDKLVLVNPPYDQRLQHDSVDGLYRLMGDTLKQRYPPATAFVFTGNLEAAKSIGLRTSKRHLLRNGALDCRLLRYEIHEGSRKRKDKPARAKQQAADPRSTRAAPELTEFRNRLAKMFRHWGKWARRQKISCFRIYDRDVPKVPFVIDFYDGRVHVAEFATAADSGAIATHEAVAIIGEVLSVPHSAIYVKKRSRQKGANQYGRIAEEGATFEIEESGLKFLVNLSDYLDTGLFLDHRNTRTLVRDQAEGARFLNLFCYTGSFSVYAAAGGAERTLSVDISNTYTAWAESNLALNKMNPRKHQVRCADVLESVSNLAAERFDLAVVDPPTFSNSKKMKSAWDIQRDHVQLLCSVLALIEPGGKVFFSTNSRRFQLQQDLLPAGSIREITSRIVPADFRRRPSNRCWLLTV